MRSIAQKNGICNMRSGIAAKIHVISLAYGKGNVSNDVDGEVRFQGALKDLLGGTIQSMLEAESEERISFPSRPHIG